MNSPFDKPDTQIAKIEQPQATFIKTNVTRLDESASSILCIFSDGAICKMLGSPLHIGSSMTRYYLSPLRMTRILFQLEEAERNDKRYNKGEDWWEIDVPDSDIIPIRDQPISHPNLAIYLFLRTWSGKYHNPMDNEIRTLQGRLKAVQAERDAFEDRINAMERRIRRLNRHQWIGIIEQQHMVGKAMDKVNWMKEIEQAKLQRKE